LKSATKISYKRGIFRRSTLI